jgi:hypothetical protein
MKEKFIDHKFQKKTWKKLNEAYKIVKEYQDQDLILTVRQIYYQLMRRGIIVVNKDDKGKEYNKIIDLLNKGRLTGLIDWDAFEDRLRKPHLPYCATDIQDAFGDIVNQYRINLQEGQNNYIEVWTEKDALSGIIKSITEKYHVNMAIDRGYSGVGALYGAHNRFKEVEADKIYVLYIGDHDPSGLDMLRDIRDRIQIFNQDRFYDFELIQVALTRDQVREYNLPPNFAKESDKRYKAYVEATGDKECWEIDALEPGVLQKLISANIERLIDIGKFNKLVNIQERDRSEMKTKLKSIGLWDE